MGPARDSSLSAFESEIPRRTEITLEVEDRPGMLASIGEILGDAGVNIVTAAVFTIEGKGRVHLVVDDPDASMAAFKDGGFAVVDVKDVLSVTLEDRPGELGKYARSLSQSGVNITSLYIAGERAGEKELIVGIDKPLK